MEIILDDLNKILQRSILNSIEVQRTQYWRKCVVSPALPDVELAGIPFLYTEMKILCTVVRVRVGFWNKKYSLLFYHCTGYVTGGCH